MSRALIALVFVGAAGLGVRAFIKARGAQKSVYETGEIARGELKVTVTATGTLAALGTVEVGSEISGRVVKVLVDYNDPVKLGQTLAEVDPMQLKAEVTQSKAQVAASMATVKQAKATLVEAKQTLERAEAQAKLGLVSDKDLEGARASAIRAEASVSSAQANAALSQANLSTSEWKLTKTTITSPIDGFVLSRSVEPGQTVAATFQTPVLFTLASDLTHMTLKVQVDEADVGRVREGMPAEFHVDAYPDRAFASRVESVRNEPKTSSNVVSYEAVLSVDNSDRLLRPGMTATATIISDSRPDALLVPNAALRFSPSTGVANGPGPGGAQRAAYSPPAAGAKRVWLLGANNALTPLDLKTGATDGRSTEIVGGGVEPGQKVVTDVAEAKP